MNTGFVKRTITVEDFDEDVFSDDIKTTALIEEIEAAEYAARQARIEQQIDASQPSLVRKLGAMLRRKGESAKETLNTAWEDWRTPVPADPRVRKVTVGERFSDISRRAKMYVDKVYAYVKNTYAILKSEWKMVSVNISMRREDARSARKLRAEARTTIKRQALAKRTPELGVARRDMVRPTIKPKVKKGGFRTHGRRAIGRINSLVPEGVARGTVVECAVAAALIVIAGEIWAWNLSHPLFEKGQVETVPVTGAPDTEQAETTAGGGEPYDMPPTETNVGKDEEGQESDTSSTSSSGATNHQSNSITNYSYYRQTQGAGASGITNAESGESHVATPSNTSSQPSTPSQTGDGRIYVDSQWDDNYNYWDVEIIDGGEETGVETETPSEDTAD